MKLSNAKQNTKAVEQGAWVENIPEAGDLRIKTRGANNSDWRRLQQKLIAQLPVKQRRRGVIDPMEMERIMTECLIEHGIIDWENLLDEDGKAIPVSKARELLSNPDYRPLKDFCAFAAQVVADGDEEVGAAVEGNSESASETTSSGAA